MATYDSDQRFTYLQGPTSSGGLAGSPQQARGAEFKGKVHWQHFTLSNSAAAVPSPSLAGASLAAADIINLGALEVVDRIIGGKFFTSAWGAGATLSIGKVDPNLAANTDAAHYLAATNVSAISAIDFNKNMGEQVGTDPTGSTTDAGNAVPGFGSAKIKITATVGGTPATSATLNGYFLYASGD